MMALPLAMVLVALGGALCGDTEMVGSSVHQAAVPPPADLLTAATHGNDKGYRHSYKTNGGDGYKQFDSFHKKDGDSYGYEKHSAFGGNDSGGDDGEYHEASSYSSDDGGAAGSHGQPKVTAYHYETKSGTPRDYSNYDPETYVGDYTQIAPRALHPPKPRRRQHDVVQRPLNGEYYQSLNNVNKDKKVVRNKEPQVAGTEEEADYDYYYDGEGEGEGEEGSSGSAEAEYSSYGGDYEGGEEGDSDAEYYY